jgi:hypothetical protein
MAAGAEDEDQQVDVDPQVTDRGRWVGDVSRSSSMAVTATMRCRYPRPQVCAAGTSSAARASSDGALGGASTATV